MLVSESRFPLTIPLSHLPAPTYLVGGAVRDWVLDPSAESAQDLDLVVEQNAVETARQLARHLSGGFVVLDPQRHIARVVLAHSTIDVAQQVGSSIENDLYHRDFTCNAVALELHSNTWIDPLSGREDIGNRRLRVVHPDNLSADPLRLLRGYRQAAQLAFQLDEHTRSAIIQRQVLLKQVAAERVRTELCHLLASGQSGINYLSMANRDGILNDWLPGLTTTAFNRVRQLHTKLHTFATCHSKAYDSLREPLSDKRTKLLTTILAVLLADFDSAEVDRLLNRLKYSRNEQRWVTAVRSGLSCLPQLLICKPGDTLPLFHFFQAAGQAVYGTVLAAIALGYDLTSLSPLIARAETPNDPLAYPAPPISGTDLIQHLGLPPGPIIGQLLYELKLARAIGKVSTAEEALQHSREWIDHRSQTQSSSVE